MVNFHYHSALFGSGQTHVHTNIRMEMISGVRRPAASMYLRLCLHDFFATLLHAHNNSNKPTIVCN